MNGSKRFCHAAGGNRSVWLRKSLLEASEALTQGRISSAELTKLCIEQIKSSKHLNAFVYTDFDRSIRLSREADLRRKFGKSIGILDGIPIGVKDNFCMENVPTTACSKMLSDFVSPYESTATNRLLDAGAIPMGKLNMDEFGMGSGTLYSEFGPTKNPWSLDWDEQAVVAGGSSGGSAAAVASGCCFAALGSDTGGSVRQPAAYCGIVGLKPSYGRVSRHGLISYASSLDTVGVLAKTVGDAAVMLEAISGPDGRDATALQTEGPSDWSDDKWSDLVVGIPAEYHVTELSPEIIDVWNQGIEWLRRAGAKVVDISLPTTKLCLPSYYIIACAEASSNLSRYDGVRFGHRATYPADATTGLPSATLHDLYSRTRSEGFGKEVQRRILLGTYMLSSKAVQGYYDRAWDLRQRICSDFQRIFANGVDLLLTPTTTSVPFSMLRVREENDGMTMYLNDVMTVAANLARIPAISIPAHISRTESLPLGLQLMSAMNNEHKLLQGARMLENAVAFSKQIPERVYSGHRNHKVQ
uniref:Glutamyl-tRNA(Gln) amidotransferase subunit A, mitochondrial n=1 Tax=Albugo laibachii Nc14 TaxID=890382 RepID=F0W0N1_9STRA|nr:glutamyltRNA(Gln) amidotransferase subunit putative [Albugo laibachii Nc14]|eukprot:CCA14603.1 glutamyltRNA(Gln) amidotransferase subunit putative [Albugo laibachii Nc14]